MKKVSTLVGIIIIIVVAVIFFGGIFAYQYFSKSQPSAQTQQISSSQNTTVSQDDFTLTFGKTYAIAKKELVAKGWIVDTKPNPDFPSVGDKQFPEIGGCGSGVDAICFVNFKKGNEKAHLDVQIGGRPPYGPYSEWTVVGNE